VVFSTIKTSKFLFDVPKIVSNWPFSNGLRTPMYASFVQCSHKFSKFSHMKSDDPSNGTESGSGNAGNVRSKVSRPLHRIFLTGIFYPTALSTLAEVLRALSEVSPEGEGEGGKEADVIGTKEDGTGCVERCPNPSNSSSIIDKRSKYSFDIYTLQNFDNAFLHPKSLASEISDKKKEENCSEDLGPVVTAIPVESARLPKIPMKFNSTIVDNLSSTIPYTVRSAARVPGESSSSSVGRLSLGGLNVLSSTYGTDDDYRDGIDSSLTDDPSWIASKRAQDSPYFVVRTASAPRMESFCHYLQEPLVLPKNRGQDPSGGSISGDTDNDSGSMVQDKREGESTGAVATMDSYLPITEIRWPSAASSAFASSSSSLTATIQTEQKVVLKNLSGKKRKHPISNSEISTDTGTISTCSNDELDSHYDVVYGAKLPVLCLVEAKHSKVIIREKIESDNSGAVLDEMNKYEIYAPETLEDRQRKRMTM
jgi:hypothetical protein